MENIEASNDNWREAIPRPRPITPRNMIEYANSMITEAEDKLKGKGLWERDIMHYHSLIKKAKDVKISALKSMTDQGYKADDICGN